MYACTLTGITTRYQTSNECFLYDLYGTRTLAWGNEIYNFDRPLLDH